MFENRPSPGRPRASLLIALGLILLLVGCHPDTRPRPSHSPFKESVSEPGSTTEARTVPGSPGSESEPEEEVDVVIVGAGLSGLLTAYHLQKDGLSYRLLEWAPRVGGRVRTGTYPSGHAAEVGLAEFWDGNPTLEVIAELGLPMEKVEPGISSFLLDGELQPFTTYKTNHEFLRAVLKEDFAEYLAWDEDVQRMLHRLEADGLDPELSELKEVSFRDWLRARGLPDRVQKTIKAVLEPEIGTTIDRIGALDGIAEWHLFAGKGATPQHVVGGNQNLTEALADRVGRSRIDLNTQVTNIEQDRDGVTVRAVDASTFENRTYRGKAVVTTLPLYRLYEIRFSPRLDPSVYSAISSQTWGAYLTAHVVLKKEAEKFWTVQGVNVLPILTGTALGVIYPSFEGGPSDTVMVNLLVTGPAAEAFNARTMSFDDVQKSLTNAWEATFPGSSELILEWTFYRYHPRAIASWPVGRSRYDELSEGLRKAHGRLYFAGDFTESSHSDGAARSALRVHRQLVERFGDPVR